MAPPGWAAGNHDLTESDAPTRPNTPWEAQPTDNNVPSLSDRALMDLHEHEISKLQLIKNLREQPEFYEVERASELIASSLLGSAKVEAIPSVFINPGKSAVLVLYLGAGLCSDPNILHGWVLAALLQEGCRICCSTVLPKGLVMCKDILVVFQALAKPEQYFVLQCEVNEVDGRKARVTGRIETIAGENGETEKLVESHALFVSSTAG